MMADVGKAGWLATADRKFGYFLSERIVEGKESWWGSRVYHGMKPGQKVLLMQTYGGSSDTLRGIYGVATVIKVRQPNEKRNNVKLRYLKKFQRFIPLHRPFSAHVKQLASKMQTPFLRRRVLAKPGEIGGFIPITKHDLPLLTKILQARASHNQGTQESSHPYIIKGREGKKTYSAILRRERNPRLVREAKNHFADTHNGRLYCEVCKFDFKERYGDRGAGFVECHHKRPVSSFRKQKTTTYKDLVMLCSNCHSMIHNQLPWLTMKQLRRIRR